jgi:hypothetical protein
MSMMDLIQYNKDGVVVNNTIELPLTETKRQRKKK